MSRNRHNAGVAGTRDQLQTAVAGVNALTFTAAYLFVAGQYYSWYWLVLIAPVAFVGMTILAAFVSAVLVDDLVGRLMWGAFGLLFTTLGGIQLARLGDGSTAADVAIFLPPGLGILAAAVVGGKPASREPPPQLER